MSYLNSYQKGAIFYQKHKLFYTTIKAILSALAVTAPVAETTYLDTGVYYSDSQTVVDSEGECWGYDAELADSTPVIITFDSQSTDSRYDDVITGLTEIIEK